MGLLMKAAAAALLSAFMGLVIKRYNPEGALLLGLICTVGILTASLGILDGFASLRKLLRQTIGGEGEGLMAPILKCLAISVVSRFSADTCRDASQNAAATAVEFAGSVCSLGVIMPLLLSMLQLFGGAG